MGRLLSTLENVLDEAAYDDTGRYAKQANKILDRLEAAFAAGYPSIEGEEVLQGRRASEKQAGSDDPLWYILDRMAFIKLYREMEKSGDKQSATLLREVAEKLSDEMALDRNQQAALNRLSNSVANTGRWDPSLQRNNIFKAANLLGINLPSAMFASEQSREAGSLRYEGNTALDKTYAMTDLLNEIKRQLPDPKAGRSAEFQAVQKALFALEKYVEKAQG